jgi:hypothetical protein
MHLGPESDVPIAYWSPDLGTHWLGLTGLDWLESIQTKPEGF